VTESALTVAQLEVLQMFFGLPESVGFVLAGGAGLLAAGISTRPTEDVDLFTTAPSVTDAGDALEEVARARGWTTERIHDATTFRRLVVHLFSTEQVLVDLAQDGGPLSAPLVTTAGPTYPPEELGARKVLALFDRAELRDFVDVANVAGRYGKARMLSLAVEIDAGFDRAVFRDMASTLDRFTDEELSLLVPEPASVRRFFSEWLTDLR
jgi:hypothetical protein